MTCAEVRDLFSALVDGELSSVERAAADTHLSGCAECRRELDRFSRTVSMVGALPAERAPVGFVDRVMEAAHPVPWPRRLARRVFVPFRVKVPMHVAAALLVATTAVWLVQRTPELQQAARQKAPAAPAEMPRAAPPAVTSPPRPAPPAAEAPARRTAPDTTAALKDEASPPAAPPEAPAKDEAGRADTARGPESRRAENEAAVAGAASKAAEAPARERVAAPGTPPLTARALEPDVTGTWRVEDRAAVARELEPLVARLGGSPVTRRTEGAVETVEFTVPGQAYDELVNVLEWFGRLAIAPRPGPLPPTVRVRLRIIG